MYDKLFLSTVFTDLLIEILEGNTRFPVTAQLLETIVETYGEAEFVPGLIGIAQGNPFIDAETLEWITRYAESTPTTNGLRTMTLTDHRADYERASEVAREHQNAIPGGAGVEAVRSVEAVSLPKLALADATMADALRHVSGE